MNQTKIKSAENQRRNSDRSLQKVQNTQNLQKKKRRRGKSKSHTALVILCRIIVYIVDGKFSEHIRWAYVAISTFSVFSIIGGIENDTISMVKGTVICIFLTAALLPVILSLVNKYDQD